MFTSIMVELTYAWDEDPVHAFLKERNIYMWDIHILFKNILEIKNELSICNNLCNPKV
jgi:hypothetical protein